jgi:hypothetical protein
MNMSYIAPTCCLQLFDATLMKKGKDELAARSTVLQHHSVRALQLTYFKIK